MRRTLATVTLAGALMLAPVATTTAYAEQHVPTGAVLAQTEETVTDDDSDDYGDWGLLGLLGLFGLLGYKKYKDHRATRTTGTNDADGGTSHRV